MLEPFIFQPHCVAWKWLTYASWLSFEPAPTCNLLSFKHSFAWIATTARDEAFKQVHLYPANLATSNLQMGTISWEDDEGLPHESVPEEWYGSWLKLWSQSQCWDTQHRLLQLLQRSLRNLSLWKRGFRTVSRINVSRPSGMYRICKHIEGPPVPVGFRVESTG